MRISDWSSDVCSSDLPSLDANGAVSRERLSAGRPIGPGVPVTADQYVLGTQLNYELDLWGRVRNEVTAGDADRAAAAADLGAVRLSLRAAIADNYLRLRVLDAQQALIDRPVTRSEERRVGPEGASTCSAGGCPYQKK